MFGTGSDVFLRLFFLEFSLAKTMFAPAQVSKVTGKRIKMTKGIYIGSVPSYVSSALIIFTVEGIRLVRSIVIGGMSVLGRYRLPLSENVTEATMRADGVR